MKKITLAILLLYGLLLQVAANNPATNSGGEVVTVQPSIMVIPYTKENEDIRTVLEENTIMRQAIGAIKEAFDYRGFTTVDFVARLKSQMQSSAVTSDEQTDFKTQLIQNSGADIYIQCEIQPTKIGSGGINLRLQLQAVDVYTGNSIANKICESGVFYTEDYYTLAKKALANRDKGSAKEKDVPGVDNFLEAILQKINEMVENGRSIVVEIGIEPSSKYKFSSEVGEDKLPLSDQIELWMGDNAYKNNYRLQGQTEVKMIFDDVRIPLRNQSNNTNYNPSRFGMDMFRFFQKLGISTSRTLTGNKLFITIK